MPGINDMLEAVCKAKKLVRREAEGVEEERPVARRGLLDGVRLTCCTALQQPHLFSRASSIYSTLELDALRTSLARTAAAPRHVRYTRARVWDRVWSGVT